MRFVKTKKIARVGKIVQTLVKYGFTDVVDSTALGKLVITKKEPSEGSMASYSKWERMRMVIEDLGPTFIKLAQLLSNRPDVLPAELITEFEKLQDKVPPFDVALAKQMVEEELGRPLDEVFSYFDHQTLGSASIGQVHRARLKTGENVVVKVQRPNIINRVRTDLALLRDFVKMSENYFKRLGILNPLEVVETFREAMESELDYSNELGNMEQLRKLYRSHRNFYIPKPYSQYSTKKVLVIEFISGCKITDIPQLEAWGLIPEKVAENGIDVYLTQIFQTGVFHADPHPGNIIIRPNGVVVLIDFGMVGRLTQDHKVGFAGMLIGLAQQNAHTMATNIQKLAIGSEIEDLQLFQQDIQELIDYYFALPDEDSTISAFSGRFQQIIYKYKLSVPGSVFLILRALAILEGIGTVLHPNFQTLEFIKPYGTKLLAEQFSFRNIRTSAQTSFSQLVSLLYVFPTEARYILKQLRSGKIHINYDIQNPQLFLDKADSITNRLIITLLICALTLSSSIMMTVDFGKKMPAPYGVPLVSIVGFGLATLLSMALWRMMRKRKPKEEEV
jgi:ubiquinone biosynthesis protein